MIVCNSKPIKKYGIRLATSSVHGRGVFASEIIPNGEMIESCDLIILNECDIQHIIKTSLEKYVYSWGPDSAVLPVGFGSFYNHSYTPNAYYLKDAKELKIHFIAYRDIDNGEEIFVNYNLGVPDSLDPVFFNRSDFIDEG